MWLEHKNKEPFDKLTLQTDEYTVPNCDEIFNTTGYLQFTYKKPLTTPRKLWKTY